MRNKVYSILCVIFLVGLVPAIFSCTTINKSPNSLYEDLGGEEGLAELVDNFLFKLADNPTINHYFADTDILRFRKMLNEQWCELAEGPCEYTGDDMTLTHAGLNINDAHFNALVDDLYDALEELNYSVSTQNRLLALLAPMHVDIVEDQ